MKMTKFWIAGSRTFNDVETMTNKLSEHIMSGDVIRTGGAKGADRLAEKIAKSILSVDVIPAILPEWNKFGKGAGFRRNKEGVDWADKVLVFWDGKSRGSKHVIDLAEKQGKLVEVIINEV